MENFLIGVCINLPLFIIIYLVHSGIVMHKDRNFHAWPSVTRCQLCDKRIFAWQRHERRALGVDLDNVHDVHVRVSGSCLVHKGCKGIPVSHVRIQIGVDHQLKTAMKQNT